MIYAAHIREDYEDGHRINGMGFVIETGDDYGGKLLLLKCGDGIWSAMYVDEVDRIENGDRFTNTYAIISHVPAIARVSYDRLVHLRGKDYHWKNLLKLAREGRTEELDSLFAPTMDRLNWIMTEDGMLRAPWLGVVDGGKNKEVKE